MHETNVYVGSYGTYELPQSLVDQAKALSGDRLLDKRTKGARLIKSWGQREDAQQRAVQGIPKWLDENGDIARINKA